MVAVRAERLLEARPDPLGDLGASRGVGFAEEDAELLATIAVGGVTLTKLAGEHRRDLLEHLVAALVAVLVVERLEVVDAAHVAKEQPERAVEALNAIRVASKEGLREMRSILNVLRQADEADQPRQPAPGLAMLDTLVGTANRAGLPTSVHVEGTPRRLPSTVDLAAYRIIQESLTNAVRHAGPASATVALAWTDGWLRVDVTDTGRGASPQWRRGWWRTRTGRHE